MRKAGFTDTIFLNLETETTPQHIAILALLEPHKINAKSKLRTEPSLSNIEKYLARHFQAIPFFRTRLIEVTKDAYRPYWTIDNKIDLSYHLRQNRLAGTLDYPELYRLISLLHEQPLDFSKPLWECHIIDGLNNIEDLHSGSFAVYMKVHHSMLDGHLAQLLLSTIFNGSIKPLSDSALKNKIKQAGLDKPYSVLSPDKHQLYNKAIGDSVKAYKSRMKKALNGANSIKRMVAGLATKDLELPTIGPKTRFDEAVSRHRTMTGLSLPFERLKPIKQRTGASINDIVICIISGAMRHYLKHHNELPPQSLIANIPVSLRMRGAASSENNQLAALMAQIHTQIANPVERLLQIQADMQNSKKLIGTPLTEPLRIVGILPPYLAKPIAKVYTKYKLTSFIPAGTPTVITNVPGPQEALFCDSAKLNRVHLLGLLTPGVGLFHSFFTTNGNATFTVLAAQEQMPDVDNYRQCLLQSLKELEESANNYETD